MWVIGLVMSESEIDVIDPWKVMKDVGGEGWKLYRHPDGGQISVEPLGDDRVVVRWNEVGEFHAEFKRCEEWGEAKDVVEERMEEYNDQGEFSEGKG